MSKGNIVEARKVEFKVALEKLRGAIRSNVPAREQWNLLQAVDRIQDEILRPGVDLEGMQREVQNAKGATRRDLRTRPGPMSQLLTAFDVLEQELVDFCNLLTKGKK